MKRIEEVERDIIKWLENPLVLTLQKKRKEVLKKQRELIEKQEEVYKTDRKQLQKQFTI